MREKRRTRRSRNSQNLVKMCEEKTDEAYYDVCSISMGYFQNALIRVWDFYYVHITRIVNRVVDYMCATEYEFGVVSASE